MAHIGKDDGVRELPRDTAGVLSRGLLFCGAGDRMAYVVSAGARVAERLRSGSTAGWETGDHCGGADIKAHTL